MDKKKIITISAICVAVIGVIIILIVSLGNGNKLVCTKTTNENGIEIKDKISFILEDKKVGKVEVEKNLEIKDDSINSKTFLKALTTTLENSYSYASENAYEIETNEDKKTLTLIMNSKKYGVILDNIKVNKNESGNYSFNAVSNIETAKNAIKIGDTYKKSELKDKAKEVGYKCK